MVFQQTGKQDNAGRFELGYLKATTENLTNWDLPGCEKPPKTNEKRCPYVPGHIFEGECPETRVLIR